jgi:hypothetical protein
VLMDHIPDDKAQVLQGSMSTEIGLVATPRRDHSHRDECQQMIKAPNLASYQILRKYQELTVALMLGFVKENFALNCCWIHARGITAGCLWQWT